eukprot:scaffold267344_cov35-Prasinocladus_malaysianus.AAC.1
MYSLAQPRLMACGWLRGMQLNFLGWNCVTGHKMMQKMGWTEGAGLGASSGGMSTPIGAGEVKQDNLGIGAANTHEVGTEDDIYEAYKKRMMLGYKYRPNPLGNPRKQYY